MTSSWWAMAWTTPGATVTFLTSPPCTRACIGSEYSLMSNRVKAVLEKLRQLREQKGWSSAQLEEQLELGPGWISLFEQGRSVPSLEMLFSILDVLGVSLANLAQDLDAEELQHYLVRKFRAHQDGGSEEHTSELQ